MSLTTDGVWKAGVWATTVWADGVWFEGTPPPVVTQTFSGGWDLPARKRRTKQEIREDREKWGVLPKKVKQLIISVAVQHVEEPDTTAPLIAAFERAELAYKAQYAELYRMEVLRQLDMMREEEEFMLLH